MNLPIITEKQILEETGWSKDTLSDKIYRGKFPKKISFSKEKGRIFNRDQVLKVFCQDMDSKGQGFNNA